MGLYSDAGRTGLTIDLSQVVSIGKIIQSGVDNPYFIITTKTGQEITALIPPSIVKKNSPKDTLELLKASHLWLTENWKKIKRREKPED